ncbi:MAG: hypothetical protein CM1200mP28_03760 [Deltaproteobacteria bacterium]|nr:MAG: hypothetical protein CM1200mP28_03760 [Deltaproteobacteria bacterium]
MINHELWEKLFGGEKNIFLIEDIQNPLIRIANCCFPIPGDKIRGLFMKTRKFKYIILIA